MHIYCAREYKVYVLHTHTHQCSERERDRREDSRRVVARNRVLGERSQLRAGSVNSLTPLSIELHTQEYTCKTSAPRARLYANIYTFDRPSSSILYSYACYRSISAIFYHAWARRGNRLDKIYDKIMKIAIYVFLFFLLSYRVQKCLYLFFFFYYDINFNDNFQGK